MSLPPDPRPPAHRDPPSEQPGPTSPSRLNKLALVAVGAGIALAAVIAVLLLAVTADGGGSPKAAAEAFLSAATDRECDEAYALLSKTLQDQIGTCSESADKIIPRAEDDVTVIDLELESQSSSQAVVTGLPSRMAMSSRSRSPWSRRTATG